MAFLAALPALASAAAAAAGTASTIGTVATVGSAVLGAGGAYLSAKAESNAAKFNARVQEQQANDELDQAGAKATETALRTRQRTAAIRATSLQNGLEDTGSVSDLLAVSQEQGALEGLTALYDGSQRARGLRTSAALNRSQAKSAMTAGYIKAGTSILDSVGKRYT